MSQESMFWPTTGIGDGVATGYTSDQWRWLAYMLFGDGVSRGYLEELAASNPMSLTLRIAKGGGIVYGFPYRNMRDVDLPLGRPVTGTTGWQIVLRADWTLQTVRLVLLQALDGIATSPLLTKTAGVCWDVSLYAGNITTSGSISIIDTREYA